MKLATPSWTFDSLRRVSFSTALVKLNLRRGVDPVVCGTLRSEALAGWIPRKRTRFRGSVLAKIEMGVTTLVRSSNMT